MYSPGPQIFDGNPPPYPPPQLINLYHPMPMTVQGYFLEANI